MMGNYSEWMECGTCPSCGENSVYFRSWDSFDGEHTDYQYKCQACKKTWWVDGPDA